MSLFSELKRRNVFRVATAYVVVGWLLTEIATTLLPTFGAPDWVAKALILVLALAFVPVLIFAWAFELTPDGIKRERDVDRNRSITSDTGKKLNYVTIAAVVAGVAFVLLSRDGERAPDPEPEVVVTAGSPSVAVLPFVNMSGNAENEYFSDGLTETLLHMLAQIPDLKVAARTSSFAFKDQQDDIRQIASALDVAHVLEGSVQRAGDRVRITAQLIRADDGFHVWSENYDRTLDDIFAIQDEIAGKVGRALSASLLGAEEPAPIVGVGTENLEAYDKFLRASAEYLKGSYGSLQGAEGLLKDALGLDPDFHDARSLLARVYLSQWMTGLTDAETGLAGPLRMLDRVLADVPDDVLATTTLYQAEFYRDLFNNDIAGSKAAAELLVEHARAHPNDVDAVMAAASTQRRLGDDEESVRLLEGLVQIDPLNAGVYYELAQAYERQERWEDVRKAGARSLEIEQQQPNVHAMIGDSYFGEGDIVGFLRGYLKAMEIDPKDHELPGQVAEALYRLGLPERAAGFRERVLSIAPSSPAAYMLDVLDAEASGDLEEARAAAYKAIDDDIDNRQGAYEAVVRFLVRDALANESAVATLRYLEGAVPSLADFDSPAVAIKEQLARFTVLPLWEATLPDEEWRRRHREMARFAQQFGFDPEDEPGWRAQLQVVDGDLDGAIESLEEQFATRPVGTAPGWRQELQRPLFSPIIDDPRVQSGMERYRRQEAELRADVAAFLDSGPRGGV